jgi:hypothetical protein
LEALKGLGQGTFSDIKDNVKQAVISDIPESFGLTGTDKTIKPNESFSLSDIKKAEESGFKRAEKSFDSRLNQIRDDERRKLIKDESIAKEEITAIRMEIQKLAKSVGSFVQEVEIAASQAPAAPGIYHKHFFAHLKIVITTLRQRVDSSRNWLSTYNSRSKKKSFYWNQVGKSGTKFMLSSERYMVTSTG